MAIIHCTQKLLSELKTKPVETDFKTDPAGNWHANIFRIDRRKCLFFTHSETLFSFIVPAITKNQLTYFDELFRQTVFKSLVREDFPQDLIEIMLKANQDIIIARSNNRRVLGSMNDLIYQSKYNIAAQGGLIHSDLEQINYDLNRTPMKAIKYGISATQLRKFLQHLRP